MTAPRALIDNAAGQPALEAMAAGLPVVSYRPIPGHGGDGAQRMAEHGLATVRPGLNHDAVLEINSGDCG
ncbi:hypothetical protein ACNPQM_27540 [Streptomyces sp. NPDC056231]|uniref:hypothetical protein n=1 Tax=Streptomyces sp. NPDC056231 TaxID=3345755 RepID=UPI003AABB4E0